MKLYTEEEIKLLLQKRIIFDDDDLDELTQIELPSDEELYNGYEPKTMYDLGYLDGAKWMRDKIQGGNNG